MGLYCTYLCRSSLSSLSEISNRYTSHLLIGLLRNHAEKAYSSHPEESILVLRSLGVQTTSISPYYLVPPTTRFIPTSQICDILIHEAFRGFEVRYYLAAIVEGEAEVVVVFPVSIVFCSPNKQIST